MSVKMTYDYRDANNYKQLADVVFHGGVTETLLTRLHNALANVALGNEFIPQQVDLDGLADRFTDSPLDPEMDTPWHGIDVDGITQTDETPTDARSFTQFVEAVEAVNGVWNDTVDIYDLYGLNEV